ncbi:MAG: hypothetical protein IPK19_13915 [Chloroflexi bacterium]|nr:hypothetical protein [Chloroflexota bacterium]
MAEDQREDDAGGHERHNVGDEVGDSEHGFGFDVLIEQGAKRQTDS